MLIGKTSLFASNPNLDNRTSSQRMVGEQRRIFLIQARREGAYSESNHFGVARVLRPDLPRRLPRSPREMLRMALSRLAWAHSKAVAISAPPGPPRAAKHA